MNVNIKELELIIKLLLSKIQMQQGMNIILDNDYYWNIPQEELYNPYSEPKNLTLGQLSDDLKEIERLLICEDDAISYDLNRVACILKAISDNAIY